MENLHVSPSTVAAIMGAPQFPALIEEYAAESSIAGMPPPNAQMERYCSLEAGGFLHAFGAVEQGDLIGFISVLSAPLLHYGRTVAVSESFFVTQGHRGMAGLKLLAAAEALTVQIGSPGLLVSARCGSRLAELLPKCGYVPSSTAFFKQVHHG